MQITEFVRVGKSNKIKIFVDGEFYATLLDETIAKNNLKLNVDYSKKFIDEVIDSGQDVLAFDAGLKLLSLFSKTEKEFADYLKNKGFKESAICYAVEKLKTYNYLNDEYYVQNYIESRRGKKGKKSIKYDLKIKGVQDEIIDKFLNNMIENQTDEIRVIAEKFLKNKEKDNAVKVKLFRHLASKGFELDEINFVINSFFE